jgi:hypothetical protein
MVAATRQFGLASCDRATGCINPQCRADPENRPAGSREGRKKRRVCDTVDKTKDNLGFNNRMES